MNTLTSISAKLVGSILMTLGWGHFLSAQVNLDSGLVAHYPFTGNTLDQSGRDNHGTNFGATLTTDRQGNANSAYAFDGVDDYIDFGDSADFRFSADFSISLWIDYPGGFQDGNVIYKRNSSNPFNQYGLGVFEMECCYTSKASNFLGAFIRDDANNGNKILGAVNDTLTPGWHHVVMNTDADGRAFMFMDGTLIDSSEISAGSYEIADFPLIVGNAGGDTDEFTGKIDDIRLYSRLLTSAEVTALFTISTTSVQSVSETPTWQVFPTPAQDRLYLRRLGTAMAGGQIRVELLSTLGATQICSEVPTSTQANLQSINLSAIPAGVYVLRITEKDQPVFHQKVIIR